MATTPAPPGPEQWAELGQWIASRRKQMGMDQRELAEAAGVSENTISNYERGRVPARGKVPAGYYRVERALHFGKGSVDAVLEGHTPTFEVEGPAYGRLALRSPDDPKFKDNPLLRDVIVRIEEALHASKLSIFLADLAARWNVPDELIERYKHAHDDLLSAMFSPGHGPVEVQRYHEAMTAGRAPKSDALEKRPDLGWTAYAVDLESSEQRESIGDVLRKARVKAGLDADELAARTKIPKRLVELLEGNDFTFPGASMHAPVYIRLLAETLGIDSQPLIERYEEEYGQQNEDLRRVGRKLAGGPEGPPV